MLEQMLELAYGVVEGINTLCGSAAYVEDGILTPHSHVHWTRLGQQ